ncbi:MAG: hypothetical protein PHV39_10340, partial [Methanomicrobium sp.]|nr:hypothetical protein [Methanomicrobium sp.]
MVFFSRGTESEENHGVEEISIDELLKKFNKEKTIPRHINKETLIPAATEPAIEESEQKEPELKEPAIIAESDPMSSPLSEDSDSSEEKKDLLISDSTAEGTGKEAGDESPKKDSVIPTGEEKAIPLYMEKETPVQAAAEPAIEESEQKEPEFKESAIIAES